MDRHYPRNRTLMWIFFAALVVLHHDWWLWNDGRLVFGFLPIGLGYQVLISLAAGALWGWAAIYAWPPELQDSPDDIPAGAALGNHHPGLTVPASIPASTPHKAR